MLASAISRAIVADVTCFTWLDLFYYLLWLRRYKAKGVKTCCYQEGVGQFERRFQGKELSPGNIFDIYKTKHILLSEEQAAPCYVPSFW